MYCRNCGSEQESGRKFCSKCGAGLSKVSRNIEEQKVEAVIIEQRKVNKPGNSGEHIAKENLNDNTIAKVSRPSGNDISMGSNRFKKIGKRGIIISICAAVIIAAAGVVYFLNKPLQSPAEAFASIKIAASEHPGMGSTTIAAGFDHSVGLKSDGTVVAVGNNNSGQCNVSGLFSDWKDIVAISADFCITAGLKKDGTVVVSNEYVGHILSNYSENWTDIAAISVGYSYIAGLKKDGTVVVTEGEFSDDIKNWRDISTVSVEENYIIGLKSDGTVIKAGDFQGDVSGLKDITAISTSSGYFGLLALKKDDTAVLVHNDANEKPFVLPGWKDIISVSAGQDIIGLKKDGTIIEASFFNGKYTDSKVLDYKDIVAICDGNRGNILALKKDGTVVATGDNDEGQCNIQDWKGIAVPK